MEGDGTIGSLVALVVCLFIRFQLGIISRAKVCGLDEHKKKKKKKKNKKSKMEC